MVRTTWTLRRVTVWWENDFGVERLRTDHGSVEVVDLEP
jgi:hypothetical protein